MNQTRFTVTATRAGKWWVLQADAVPNAITQVKKLSDAQEWIAEALSMVLKKAVSSDQIDLAIEVEPHLQDEIERTRKAIAELAQTQEKVASQSRELVRSLKSMQLTGVDIAAVLQISPQRVSQLLK